MSMYRVPRTAKPMLKFLGDLIAKHETGPKEGDGRHRYNVRLFRTEAPGYVLAVDYRGQGGDPRWADHTPSRSKVADLFRPYVRTMQPQGPARELFSDATQVILAQAPELEESVQWSSVLAMLPEDEVGELLNAS